MQFIDAEQLRNSGIFPQGKEPSIRTIREWTKRRLIPYTRIGGFVYFNLDEVRDHLNIKMKVKARAA